MNATTRFKQSYFAYQRRTGPEFFERSGGEKMAVNVPDTRKANGLTLYIEKVMLYLGHHAKRVATQGRKIPIYGEQHGIIDGKKKRVIIGERMITTSGHLGATDIDGHINNPNFQFAIPIYIEIKIGKDTMKERQVEYKHKVESTGAIHAVIKTPDDFWTFYDYVMSLGNAERKKIDDWLAQ